MQSLIIISKSTQRARDKVLQMAREEKISNFDVFTLTSEKQIGIQDIKNLTRQIFLKPLRGDKKMVVLEAFFGATIDAQNAFLKVLEEPPLSTTIIILASSNFFLPTIVSRCKLIELSSKISFEENEEGNIIEILEDLKKAEVGERLKIAQDLAKDKESTLLFLEKLIVAARNEMVKKQKVEYGKQIVLLQKYYRQIKQSNVNLRLGLESLFLEL
ncbi:MAG: hypothetical protein HY344_01490 [Candidatus Levybacteria bacterium]|nr:hypothetical protein [Candidatus Levybacteria bacterium]